MLKIKITISTSYTAEYRRTIFKHITLVNGDGAWHLHPIRRRRAGAGGTAEFGTKVSHEMMSRSKRGARFAVGDAEAEMDFIYGQFLFSSDSRCYKLTVFVDI